MRATQHTLSMADTPSVNVRLARGQLHRLVRCRRVETLAAAVSMLSSSSDIDEDDDGEESDARPAE